MLTAIHVLEHLDDDTAADTLATWRRVLCPGGRALVVMPDPAGRGHALAGERGGSGFADPTHINLKPHAQWRELLVAHGFVVRARGHRRAVGRALRPPAEARSTPPRAVPAFAQFLAGRLVLPPGRGESSVFVVERSGKVRP